MKVKQLWNEKGKDVPNQFIIFEGPTEYFQSYRSTVAKLKDGERLVLGRDWDYSATTLKWLKRWMRINSNVLGNMGEKTKKEIQKLIDEHVVLYDEEMY